MLRREASQANRCKPADNNSNQSQSSHISSAFKVCSRLRSRSLLLHNHMQASADVRVQLVKVQQPGRREAQTEGLKRDQCENQATNGSQNLNMTSFSSAVILTHISNLSLPLHIQPSLTSAHCCSKCVAQAKAIRSGCYHAISSLPLLPSQHNLPPSPNSQEGCRGGCIKAEPDRTWTISSHHPSRRDTKVPNA